MGRYFEVVSDKFRKKEGEVKKPTRADVGSAGYDFYSTVHGTVKPNEIIKVWTDLKVVMEKDEALLLDVRSSMGGKWQLANTIGVVDSTYHNNPDNDGNIGIFLKNISDKELTIEVGDKIAQGIFIKYLITDDDEPLSQTREGGFGSTGR